MNSAAEHILNHENRVKIIDQFCKIIALSSTISVFLYLYLGIYSLSIITGIVGAFFLYFSYLNKRGYYNIAIAAIVLTTAIGIIYFSLFLGYDSGIYLYLYVTPLLIFVLYDFDKKRTILAIFLLYLSSFIIISLLKNAPFPKQHFLDSDSISFIYSFNFCSSFVLCFSLVTFLANKNNIFIKSLKEQSRELEEENKRRMESEGELVKSLKEREILLAEIHHRVKNNLAVMSALLNIQISGLKDSTAKNILEETKNRIFSMSLVHNMMYKNKSIEKIDLTHFFNTICTNVSHSFQGGTKIIISQDVENVDLSIDSAVPMALILNELLTNAFKHAFLKHNKGNITVGIKNESDGFSFYVHDDGIGMTEDKLENGNTGMMIIQSLVEQLGGQLCYMRNGGSQFTIKVPLTFDQVRQVYVS